MIIKAMIIIIIIILVFRRELISNKYSLLIQSSTK